MDDKAIILLLKRRADKGIYEAIRKYEGVLTAVAYRILGDPQDVEECVSDAFVGVWKHIDTLDAETGSLKGYLICTVRNMAINRCKQRGRNHADPLQEEIAELASEEDMENQIFVYADTQVILGIIQQMGKPDREIILRKYFLFQQIKEIADNLGLKPNQVKYKLQCTRARLKDALIQKGVILS